ncbi:hypothetical protein E1B28_007002 [Marasmius oreades]|uniref:Uncharacterized protein n=1 Tax=Marasmius oreades TaxID=181124 RepID=A0A9P7UTL1_9AGAR|nr:uncharacterized protein E1B28_007002 [Marasmius oreades]KAG7093320.1 hypothetical protein E1B28_007002 [Marasmius oreades]
MIRRFSNSLKGVTLTVRIIVGESFSPDLPLSDLLQSASELTHFALFVVREYNDHVDDDADSHTVQTSDRSCFDGTIPSLLSRLKDHPRNFLPKLVLLSLELPDITLNTQLVEHVLGAVWARQLTPHPLTNFRLVRLDSETESGDKLVIDPEQLTEIKLLKESRINVMIEDRLKM